MAEVARDPRSQRLVGLLHASAEDGALALQGNQWSQLETASQEIADETERAERSTAEVALQLDRAGMQCRVLKGAALAHLDYPAAAMRPYVHVNILVKAEEFVDAVGLLGSHGYHRAHAEPAVGFDSKFRKGTDLMSSAGTRVELHRTIADGPYAMIVDHSELFTTSTQVLVGGEDLLALGPEERLLHACSKRGSETRSHCSSGSATSCSSS